MKHKFLFILYLLTVTPYSLAHTTKNTVNTQDYEKNEISSLQKDKPKL